MAAGAALLTGAARLAAGGLLGGQTSSKAVSGPKRKTLWQLIPTATASALAMAGAFAKDHPWLAGGLALGVLSVAFWLAWQLWTEFRQHNQHKKARNA